MMLSLAFAQCDTYRSSSAQRRHALPRKTLKAVRTSDSIVAYRIDAMSDAVDSLETLCGFAVKGSPAVVEEGDAADLLALVDSFASRYSSGKVKKLSTFIPDAGFKFCSPKDSVVLLLDLHADLCMFCHKEKQHVMDTDSIRDELSLLLKSVFKESRLGGVENGNAPANGISRTNEAEEAGKTPGEAEYVRLDSGIRQMIATAKEATCYIIDPLARGDAESEKLDKYVVLQKQKVDGKELMEQLRQAIAGEKSFEKFEYVKNCTFLPDVAFLIQDKGRTLHILFSFYCNECEMRMDGKLAFRNDCSLIQPEIIRIARRIFPKDKYLRTIK